MFSELPQSECTLAPKHHHPFNCFGGLLLGWGDRKLTVQIPNSLRPGSSEAKCALPVLFTVSFCPKPCSNGNILLVVVLQVCTAPYCHQQKRKKNVLNAIWNRPQPSLSLGEKNGQIFFYSKQEHFPHLDQVNLFCVVQLWIEF